MVRGDGPRRAARRDDPHPVPRSGPGRLARPAQEPARPGPPVALDQSDRDGQPHRSANPLKETTMTSFRKTALVGGLLYLITFVGSIASAMLVGPALNDPAYILGAGADQQIGLAGIFEL